MNSSKNHSIEKLENNCFECAYCVRHYYNLKGIFRLTNCMHCINDSITIQSRRQRIANKVRCDCWQPQKIQIEKRREDIEKYLRSTAEKLNEIAQILKEDSKKKK